MDSNYHQTSKAMNRIISLYPNVNENETPLPRSWSSKDKCASIGLTQNNLRVHYKGTYIYIFIDILFFIEYFIRFVFYLANSFVSSNVHLHSLIIESFFPFHLLTHSVIFCLSRNVKKFRNA